LARLLLIVSPDDQEDTVSRLRWLVPGIALLALQVAASATSLWTISDDPNNFVPDQLSFANSTLQTVTTVATLGNGSLGFDGGLTTGPGGVLYAIANDSTGAGSFYRVQPNGSTALVGTAGGLGFGFSGGLAYDSANGTFYAAVEDTFGNSSLYSITPGAVSAALSENLGTGFSGLAYDSANGLFYGIGNDTTGFSTLYDFSLGGPVNLVGALGSGFGGLTYDSASNVFWAIQGVNNAGSQLFQISPTGVESNALMTLGDGFVELAVNTPEPAPFATIGLVLLIGASALRKKLGGALFCAPRQSS
jgi:hypothetical protein